MRMPEGVSPLLLAGDPTLERALLLPNASAPGFTVRTVPWGVLSPPAPRPPTSAANPRSLMMIGNGRDAPAWAAALTGVARAAKEHDLLVFCDSLAARRAELWPLARKLGLLDRLSLIEELQGRRDLLLAGDILILPEAHGEQRSVVLEAMAGGMTVCAADDPMSSLLRTGETAILARNADADSWARALHDLLADPAAQAALRDSAHRYVRTHRKASDHVRGVLSAYEWLTKPDAIPFPTGTNSLVGG